MASVTPNARNFQETTSNVADKAKDAAGNMIDKAKDAADKSRDFAGNVADKTKDVVSTAAHRVQDMGKSAVNAADSATSRLGNTIETAGDRLRDKGPHDGLIGAASSTVAETLERGGRYLQHEGISGMAEDVTNLIKRNPIPALLIGLGVGYLIGRALRS